MIKPDEKGFYNNSELIKNNRQILRLMKVLNKGVFK